MPTSPFVCLRLGSLRSARLAVLPVLLGLLGVPALAAAPPTGCAASHYGVAVGGGLVADLGQYVAVTVTAYDNTPAVLSQTGCTVTLSSSDAGASFSSSSTGTPATNTYTYTGAEGGTFTYYVAFGTKGVDTVTVSDANATVSTSPGTPVSPVLFSNSGSFVQTYSFPNTPTYVGSTSPSLPAPYTATQTLSLVLSGGVTLNTSTPPALAPGFGSSGANDFSLGTPNCDANTPQTCTLAVTFQPSRAGTRQAPLVITTNAPDNGTYYLGLSGVGTSGALGFTPGVIRNVHTFASNLYQSFGSVDSAGNIYIADFLGHGIYKLSTGGVMTLVAGTGTTSGSTTFPNTNPTSALIWGPEAVKVDAAGNLYIADTSDNVVLRLDATTNTLSRVAGVYVHSNGSFGGDGGPATSADLAAPTDVALDGAGDLFIADYGNSEVREVSAATGVISNYAGTGNGNCTTNCVPNFGTPNLAAGQPLSRPTGVALDGAGNLYVTDKAASAVYEVAISGDIELFAGSCTSGVSCTAGSSGDGGAANAARFQGPVGIAVDTAGDVYVVDATANVVRRVDAHTGLIHTIAGGGTPAVGIGDNRAATDASLSTPQGVWVDSIGTVYIGDQGDAEIRSIAVALGEVSDFKAALLGTTTAAQSLLIANVGNYPLSLSSFTPTGTNAGDYAIQSTTCASPLAQGDACDYSVNFKPGALGQRNAALTTTGATATMTGAGVELTVTPPSGYFSSGADNTLDTNFETFTLTNPATNTSPSQSITLGSSLPTGAQAANFDTSINGTDACSGQTLVPGANCSVTVAYTSSSTADSTADTASLPFADSGALAVVSPGGSLNSPAGTVPLSGTVSGAPSSVTAVALTNNQSATIGATFGQAFQVQVLDNSSHGVEGDAVTFTAPNNYTGVATGWFADTGSATTTVYTDASGIATATAFTANTVASATAYQVTASESQSSISANLNATNNALSQAVRSTTTSPMTLAFDFNALGLAPAAIGDLQVLMDGQQNGDFAQPSSLSGAFATTECVAGNAYNTGTNPTFCTVEVNFSPSAPGMRRGSVVLYGGSTQPLSPIASLDFGALGTGPAVTFNPGTPAAASIPGLTGMNRPLAVKADAAGNLYIAASGGSAISQLAAGSNTATTLGTVAAPNDIALDPSGTLYVTRGTASIAKLVRNDGVYAGVTSLNCLSCGTLDGAVVDGNGDLFVAGSSNHQIYMYPAPVSSNGNQTIAISGTLPSSPAGMALDGTGGLLYIADPGLATPGVLEVNLASGVGTEVTTGNHFTFSYPTGVAVDAAGDVFVSDSGLKEVVEIPNDGVGNAIVVSGGITFATGGPGPMGLDAQGNLYVGDGGNSSGNVYKIDLHDAPTLPAFAATAVGYTGTSQTVTLSNIGNTGLTFGSPLGVGTSNFSTTATACSGTLAAGMGCALTAQFTPQAAGAPLTDVFTVTDNALNVTNAQQSFDLSGVGDASQTITFPTIGAQTYGASPLTLAASGGLSGNPVTFSVVSGPGSVSGANNSILTITGAGAIVVAANQAGSSDYNAATQVTQTVTVNPLTLTVVGLAGVNKVYNGNTTATVTGTAALSGILNSDNVTLTGTPSFAFTQATVGGSITINTSGYTLGGTAAGSYTLTPPTLSANITAAPLTVTGLSASNKQYNGTAAATLTGTATVAGATYLSDAPALSGTAVGTFASVNVGTGISVGLSGLSLTGTGAGNYSITGPTAPLAANITTAPLTVSGLSASSKQYNGTAAATLTGTATLAGATYLSDAPALSGTAVGTFASVNVGTGISVGLSGLSLTGSGVGNYSITGPTAPLAANITAAPLTVTGLSASNKQYNGTAAATLTGTPTLAGATYLSDAPALSGTAVGTFASVNVGTGISVGLSGLSLTGSGAGNYSITGPTAPLAANITAAPLTVTGLSASNKQYNGTAAATLTGTPTLAGATYLSDAPALSGTAVGTFASVNVGTGISVGLSGLSLTGSGAGNYSITGPTAPLAANITAAPLTVSGLSASNRQYNGTAVATLTGTATVAGATYLSDAPALSGTAVGTFASVNVGTGISVGLSGLSLTGSGAGDYSITGPTAPLAANITAAPLTVTGLSASNRQYNGTAVATLTGTATVAGATYLSDAPALSGTAVGTFASVNVGTGISVGLSGLSLTGSGAGNYSITGPTAPLAANITAAPLTITGLSASSKQYNGTAAATLTGTPTLAGATYLSDAPALSGTAVGTFASVNVGTGISVGLSGLSLTGSGAGNYSITGPTAPLAANITAAPLTVTGLSASNKQYNGTAAATLTGTPTLAGATYLSDAPALSGTAVGTFASVNVGTGISVGLSGLSLTGTGAGNYSITGPTAPLAANITAAPLTVSGLSASSKQYNGTAVATLTGTATLAGSIYGSDAPAVSGTAVGTFASVNVGTGISVGLSGLSLTGSGAGDYSITGPTAPLAANITAAPLTVTGLSASNRQYNGTAVATLTGTATLAGSIYGSDAPAVSGTATGTFASSGVGSAIAVNVTGLSLTGSGAGNYSITGPTAPLAANITAAPLTVTGLSASNKQYNGTAAATLTGTATLAGATYLSDAPALSGTAVGTFASVNVGTGISVGLSGLSLTGSGAGNYSITGPTTPLAANITAAPLTVTGLSASNRQYNGTAVATLTGTATLAGSIYGSDAPAVSGTATGTFASSGVGSGVAVNVTGLSLTGTGAGNYSITGPTAPLAANITAAPLTVTGLSASNKQYNGTAAATLTGTATLAGSIYGSDAPAVSGTATGTFASSGVGSGVAVNVTGLSLTGTGAGNYSITGPIAPLAANITAAPLTVTGLSASNKQYNGTAAATLTGTPTLAGATYLSDAPALSGTAVGTFASVNVGTGISVGLSGLSLTGSGAGNYSITGPTAPLAAIITAAPLTVTGLSASNKQYNGTAAATLTGTPTVAGTIYGSDAPAVSGTATGTFASSGVGSGVAVNVTGLSLTGTGAGNYSITGPTAPLAANITAAPLTVTGLSASNKQYNGTAAATLTGTATLAGTIYGSDAPAVSGTATGTFASSGVGSGVAVNVTGLSLTGTGAGNYSITGPTTPLAANITAAPLTVSGLSASSKQYNGTAAATLTGTPTLAGATYLSDAPALSGTAVGTFASVNVGTGISVGLSGLSLTGSGAGNYSITGPTTPLAANITAAPLTVSGITAGNKVYDGTTAAALTGTPTLVGTVYPGDAPAVSGSASGSFASANVGSALAVAVTGLGLNGVGAGNYALTGPTVALAANITAAPLAVTAANATRAYGAANPSFTVGLSGFVHGETQTGAVTGAAAITTPATASSDTGTYPITPAAGTLAAVNYSFGFVNGTLTVTPATQTITFGALANHNFGDAPFALSASSSSGLGVTLAVTSGPATISGDVVALTGDGIVTITASQPGNADYAAATPVSQSFAVASQASLNLNAAGLNFGTVAIGSSSGTQTVVATNNGQVPITMSSVVASGDYAAAGNCAALAPGASCTLLITFTPTALGTRAGALTFTDSATGSPQAVSLTGTGAAPGVIVTPTVLSFGSQLVGTTSTGQSITIENTGTAPLHVSSVVATGDFAAAGNCAVIPAGSNCSVEVTFTPAVTGNRTGTLTVTDDGGSGAQTVALSGNGSAAGVALAPSSLSFPGTLVGTTSFNLTANLTNTGTSALTGIAVGGGGDFGQTNNCPTSLAAGASCTLTVTFTPTVVGAETGTATVSDNLGQQLLALSGIGLAPSVGLSSGQLIFGGQLVGTSSNAQTVTLTNGGTAALSLTSVTPSPNFGDTTNCSGSLAAGASCSINVYFLPGVTGPLSGTVTVSDAVGTQVVTTTGQGLNPGLELTPSFAIFGGQVVGTSSLAQTLTLTNNGTVTLTLSPMVVTGDYQETDACPATLTPGQSCELSLVFAPTALGNRAGALTVTDTGNQSEGFATFNGQGTIPGLVASPANLDFGTITVGSTSLTQTVTLTNSGSAPASVGSIVVDGDFAETDDCTAGPIAPGGLCVINVSMSPTTTGTRTGTVHITDNSAGLHDVALTGAGQSIGLDIFPTQLAFGSLPVPLPGALIGLSGTQLSVTLTNVGSQAITFTGFSTQGDFTESDTCTTTLAPAARCVLSINFIATAVGHRTGTLTIHDNVGGGVQVVSLQGDGSPGGLVLTPPYLNFGVQTIGVTSASQPATLTNQTGSNITNLVVSPSGEYNEANTCGTALANGAACTINISITPVAVGAITGTVNVSGTIALPGANTPAGPAPQGSRAGARAAATQANFTLGVVALTATANPPGVGLSAPNLSFSLTAIGVASTGQTLTLTNTGTGLPLTGLIFNSSPEFPFTTNCPTTLVKQASCTITVTFLPEGPGLRTGFFNIIADGGIFVPVPESGLALGPQLTLAPNTMVFAPRPVATSSAAQTLLLQNTGAQPLILSSLTVSSPEYAVLASGCGSLPQTLAAGGTCGVSVRFTPGARGPRFAVLVIKSNTPGGVTVVNLQGTGTTAGLTLAPLALAFGAQGVGVASAPQTIAVSNGSGAAVAISSVAVTPSTNYTETNTCGASLAANATCSFTVVFTPTAVGEQDASIAITSNAGVQSIALTGAGSDFAIDYAGNSPAASTNNGARTTYNLSLTSLSGDNQTIALTCTVVSGYACSVSPTAVAIGAQPGTFTLILTANGASAAVTGSGGGASPNPFPGVAPDLPADLVWLGFGLSLLLMLGAFLRRRRVGLTLAGATLLLVFSAACAAPQPPAAPSTTNVTVTAVSNTGATHSKPLNLVIE